MTLKTYKTAVRASAFLAVLALSGGAFATGGISESFEGETFDTKLTGNGTLTAADVSQPAMGYPIPATNHTQALEIAGTVTYTESSTPETGASQVDFMFKVEPTDELEDPSGDDIRVALAVGTNDVGTTTAPIKLWCKTASDGAAAWVDLASAVTTGSWVRATLVLDYVNSQCSVSLNGNPALNNGDKWFYFVNAGSSETRYVQSITMVGSTLVDDFVVAHNANESSLAPAGATGVIAGDTGSGVTYDYINKYGVTVDQAKSSTPLNAASGMTVAQKFVAGLDPKSPTKFEFKTIAPASNNINKMKVTFPGDGATYTVFVTSDKEGTGASSDSTQTKTTAGSTDYGETINEAEITLPSGSLGYIHLRATK